MSEIEPEESLEFRSRRQRRTAVTIAIVLLSLAGAFYYASTYFSESAPKPGPCTTEVAAPVIKPADVSINVYNSTNQRGLALAVSKIAASRGFKIAAVANDPKKATIKEVAQIRHGAKGAESAKLVAQHLPGAVLVKDDREDETVDLVLGSGYKTFGPVPTVTKSGPTLPPCPTVTVEG